MGILRRDSGVSSKGARATRRGCRPEVCRK